MPREQNMDYQKYAFEYDPIKIASIDGTDTEPHDRAIVRAMHSEYSPNKLVKGNPSHTLFICRLNPRTTEEILKSEFSKFGRILKCRVVRDIVTGKSKQYAFIEFESVGCVERALKEMQKEYLDGSEMILEREAERRLPGWRPRRLGGGFGGRKESGQLRFGCQDRPFRKPITIIQKEVKGWCKSFTRTEGLLTILEAVLLIVFIGFFVFLVLHFVACQIHFEVLNTEFGDVTVPTVTTTASPIVTSPIVTSTLSPDVECTWEPSQKTTAHTRHYVTDSYTADVGHYTRRISTTPFDETLKPLHYYDDDEFLENSNGESASDIYKNQVVALVKFKPPGDLYRFHRGSGLAGLVYYDRTVRRGGAVAAAQRGGRAPAPALPGTLRSARALRARAPLLSLPRMIDYFLVALGERLLILGYGGYRTVDKTEVRRLRQVSVFVTATAACGGEGAAGWAQRHLTRGAAVAERAASNAAPLCAGARWARGAACNYCAGAPLVRGGALLGIMSDNSDCGVTCEPQLYVNLAALRDWIDNFVD
ncbi:hypothetical protein SFRURICE_004939 [Spodoptera frugiperda]|nr:hypothetical protein SFRURICE_004939 [Spodoptera frugiperda]